MSKALFAYFADELLESGLKSGAIKTPDQIPEEYLEAHHIVDPRSEEGHKFQKYCERLAAKIAPEHTKPTVYLLVDDDVENALAIAGHQTQIVKVHKGAFKKWNTEDKFVSLLRHELRHDEFVDQYGHVPNSIEEERDCDRAAIDCMFRKDEKTNKYLYNPNEAVELLFGLAASDSMFGTYRGLLDVHGIPALRADAAKIYVSAKLMEEGELPPPTPLPPEIAGLVKSAKYDTYKNRFSRKYSDYEVLPPLQKMQAIIDEIHELRPGMYERVFHLAGLISAMPLNKDAPEEHAVMIRTMQAIAQNPTAFGIYESLMRKLKGRSYHSTYLEDNLEFVSNAMQAFVDARPNPDAFDKAAELKKMREEVHKAALVFVDFFDKAAVPLCKGLDSINLPNFELNARRYREKKAPWLRHVKWAVEDMENGDPTIAKALAYMGILPFDVLDTANARYPRFLKDMILIAPVSLPQLDSHAHDYRNVVLDRNGAIEQYVSGTDDGSIKINRGYATELLKSIEQDERRKLAESTKPSADNKPVSAEALHRVRIKPPSLALGQASPVEVAKDFEAYFWHNLVALKSPWCDEEQLFIRKDREREVNPLIEEVWDRHIGATEDWLKKLHGMVQADRAAYMPLVKQFFLGDNQGCNARTLLGESMFGRPHLLKKEDDGENNYQFLGFRLFRHPYVEYVLKDPDGLFTLKEKLQFFGNADKTLPLSMFDELLKPQLSEPMGKEALLTKLDEYRELGEHFYPAQVFAAAMIANYLKQHRSVTEMLELIERYPGFFDYIGHNDVAFAAAGGYSNNLLVNRGVQELSRDFMGSVGTVSYGSELARELAHPATVAKNYPRNLKIVGDLLQKVKHWPEDTETLIALYQTLERGKLAPTPEMLREMAKRVMESLRAHDEPQDLFRFASMLLCYQDIQNPQLREEAIALWCKTVHRLIGRDPGYTAEEATRYAAAKGEDQIKCRTAYHARLREMIEPVQKNLSLARRLEIYAKLAETLETQKEISDDLGSEQLSLDHDTLMRAEGKLHLSEGLVSAATSSRDVRRATLDFLTVPLTKDSVVTYAKALDTQLVFQAQGRLDLLVNPALQQKYEDVEEDEGVDEGEDKSTRKKKSNRYKVGDIIESRDHGPMLKRSDITRLSKRKRKLEAQIEEKIRQEQEIDAQIEKDRTGGGNKDKIASLTEKRAKLGILAQQHELTEVLNELEYLEREFRIYDEIQSIEANRKQGEIRAINDQLKLKQFSDNPANQMQLVQMYENFWAAPLLARAAILDQLMTTAAEKAADYSDSQSLLGNNFQESLNYTIDKVVPNDPTHEEGNSIIRTMLRAYVTSVDTSQASLFLASALAANRQSQERETPMNAPEIAATILLSMGPYERKICQAISNSPELAPETTRPFALAKGEGFKIPRWLDIQRYYEVTTPEFRSRIKRIGARLGGASIFTNYEMFEHDGTRYALGMKEKNASLKAERGAATARRFVKNLREIDSALASKIPETLEDILTIADRMTQDELDPKIGLEQHKLMPKLYDGVTVAIQNREYPFHISATHMKAYGDDMRYTPIVEGEHFEKIASHLNATPDEERDLAIGHLTVILRNLLGGVPEEIRGYYDTDDHDAQGRGKRGPEGALNHYGRFDPGGISLHRRTREESEQLANVLINVLIEHLGGMPLATAMHQQIKKIRDDDPQHRTPEHLVGVQRTLLAASNFIKKAGNDNVIRILVSLYHAGQIDPIISSTIQQRLSSEDLQAELMGKVIQMMGSGSLDGKLMEAFGTLSDKPDVPFVTITQEKQRDLPEPEYVQLIKQKSEPVPQRDDGDDAKGKTTGFRTLAGLRKSDSGLRHLRVQ